MTSAPGDGQLSGNIFHGPAFIQVGDGNQQNNYLLFPSDRLRPPPPPPEVDEWVVDRAEADAVITAVCSQDSGTVGITTALVGAGGIGKTTLASVACTSPRVRQHFAERVYVVTMGRDVRDRAAIARKVGETIRFITEDATPFEDPNVAGAHLGRLLDQHRDHRFLLVIDDVWTGEQLAPFLFGGHRCVRLVTTRRPEILPTDATRVQVDEMSSVQARKVLTWQLATRPGENEEPLPEKVTQRLLRATGGWPLLLRLTNRVIAAQIATGVTPAAAAEDVLRQLERRGPTAVDDLAVPVDLDYAEGRARLDDPEQRKKLVRATIEAGTSLLHQGHEQKFAELGIFAGGEAVPVLLAAKLWHATGGLGETQARQLCSALNSLSLVTLNPGSGGRLTLHDVIRDYLRGELGHKRIAELNAVLVDAVEAGLPPAAPLARSATQPPAAWWELTDAYMLDHAIGHLLAAGRTEQAEAVACDLRWVETRLHGKGPTAPMGDCAQIRTPAAGQRAQDIAQAAHLLAPTEPAHALTTILHSRLEPLVDWHAQVAARQRWWSQPTLRNYWTPPDLPHSALIRTIGGHRDSVNAVAIAPDGTWLATAGNDRTVRIWDPVTGNETTRLTGHRGAVNGVVIAPDGTWLASTERSGPAGTDGTWLTSKGNGQVSVWDPVTGRRITRLFMRGGEQVTAIAPDGTWFATNRISDGLQDTCVWDPATGRQIACLTGHTRPVWVAAVAPDGTWLATVARHETSGAVHRVMHIWDAATGTETAQSADLREVKAVAVAPDGTWLAVAGFHMVRIIDPSTAQEITRINAWRVMTVAVAPDGTWLATTNSDGMVQIWDRDTGAETATLAGHAGMVTGLAVAPDGTWLATAGFDGTVRIWDKAASGRSTSVGLHRRRSARRRRDPDTEEARKGVWAVAVAPDGTWLATTGDDYHGTVTIWDRATGRVTTRLTRGGTYTRAIAVLPHGNRLATTSLTNGTVTIWDRATGDQIASRQVSTPIAVAVAPDGTWLATVGSHDHNGFVTIWDLVTGDETARLTGHVSIVNAVAVAPDGNWLATAGFDGTVRTWDRITGDQIACGYVAETTGMRVMPGGTWEAILRDDEFDEDTGMTNLHWYQPPGETTRRRYNDQLNGLAIAPDGTWLATAGSDGTVRIWDPATGTETTRLTGHRAAVKAVAVAPGGTWLASVGFDGTVRVWERESEQVVTMMRTDGPLSACAWTPDGSGLVAGGERGVYFYEFRPGPPQRKPRRA